MIGHNKMNANRLKTLQKLAGIDNPLCVLCHTQIRWTSMISCFQRLLSLQKYIVEIIDDDDFDEMYWNNLASLFDHEFFSVFQSAIYAVQSDSASLYSVWASFNSIIYYYSHYQPNNNFPVNPLLILL